MYTRIFPYFWLCWNRQWGPDYVRFRRAFGRNLAMSADEIRDYQWQLLGRTIRAAYEHVPFYRKRFDEYGISVTRINTPDDFRRIPLLTRRDVQLHRDELCATNVPPEKRIRNKSSGSTGNPVVFFHDARCRGAYRAFAERSRAWAGYQEGDKVAIVWGAERDIGKLGTLARLRQHYLVRRRWLNADGTTADRMEQFARTLIRWKPTAILAYPSILCVFANFLRDSGLDRIRPRAIEVSAETLAEEQRELIENVFQCKVFNCYGSREISSLAYECEAHNGMHVISDNVYLEILHGDRPAAPGEIGEIVLTSMWNNAMPLIRYQIGDMAQASGRVCSCGRPFPLLEKVLGRMNHLVVTPAGEVMHSSFFKHLFFDKMEGIAQYLVHQKSLTHLSVSFVADPPPPPALLDEFRRQIHAQMGPTATVELKVVDSIPATPTNKYRCIVSEVPPPFAASPA